MATTQPQVIEMLTRYEQHQQQAALLLAATCTGDETCLTDECAGTAACLNSDSDLCTCSCTCPSADQNTAAAQVHATLAQAAIDAAKLIASLA